MTPAITIIGSLNMDFVVRVKELPAPGQTVLGRDFMMTPGGKGANQACAAGRLGAGRVTIRMAGRVGYDLFADHLRASLSAAGVDVASVCGSKSQATGVALIWVDDAGENSIVVAPGANLELRAADVESLRGALAGSRFALFQLETPLETVRAAMALAHEEGAQAILDPAPAQPLSRELLELADILTPNETEALALLGLPRARVRLGDAPALSRSLRGLGARAVILKLGDQGCLFDDGNRQMHYPAFPVEVRDTTAAGDVFNAALAVALAGGQTIQGALQFACAAAAVSVTRPGAQASIPTRAEVEYFLSGRV